MLWWGQAGPVHSWCQAALHGPASAVTVSPAVPQARYVQAKLSVHDRSLKVATVIESLEMEMELLCLTGVEDQLQADVRPTLETLRNAGIKVGRPACELAAEIPVPTPWAKGPQNCASRPLSRA